MKPRLAAVASMLPDPPYPADTRTAGWRFQLDPQRVLQSDTWSLAMASKWPEARPWLLMIWFVAWQEIPGGTLPSDEELIAAKIGMSAEMFEGHRAILMRKWYRASDGRMYHPTMSELVLAVMTKKSGTKERVNKFRSNAKKRDVTTRNALQSVTVTTGLGVEVGGEVDVGGGVGVDTPLPTGDFTLNGTTKSKPLRTPRTKKPSNGPAISTLVWEAYEAAFRRRYQADPSRGPKVNGQLANFVTCMPQEYAPAVAAFYVDSNKDRYVREVHSIGLMLNQAGTLYAEWQRGKPLGEKTRIGGQDVVSAMLDVAKAREAGNGRS